MTYRNTITGVTCTLNCTINSDKWECLDAPIAINNEKPVKRTRKKAVKPDGNNICDSQ